MEIFNSIVRLINEHLTIPLYQFVDNLNYTLAEQGFDYLPEYTVFFTLLLECAFTALLLYFSGYIVYLIVTTIYRKVFKL